jgi:hypothetical protein
VILIKRKFFLLDSYRHLAFAAVGWLIYVAVFFLLKALIQPKYFIHCRLDDLVPFVKWFFLFYCTWYLYLFFPLLFFGLRSRDEFVRLQTYLFTGLAVTLTIYVIFPNAIAFRPDVNGDDPISVLMASMFAVDSSTMVIPSMHVFASVAVHLSLTESELTRLNKKLRIFSFILMVLICMSTVLIKQHSVLDVFCGVILAIILYFPFYRRQKHLNLKMLFNRKIKN